ncbi:MAG: CDF family Co(II)/Ni(II) efflux transporter DmeF [Deltaproteobacteria bacterium]|nr:CDF family Co(II)/Ni(II) efflux transporter DmeF [Deltaproteobacteria bacterium]
MTTSHTHDYIADDRHLAGNERKTLMVVIITATMMVLEIVVGYLSSSMALFADGWHMASHATALFIAFMAYRLARSRDASDRFSFGAGKFIPLGGYTSAVILGMIAVLMFIESARRLLAPVPIEFNEAIAVAAVGLLVNIISAVILGAGNHDHHENNEHHEHGARHDHAGHHHHDHNMQSAYIHVLADAVTSVLAIGALVLGKIYSVFWLDALVGMVGSVVILNWGFTLARNTAWELLDGHAKSVDRQKLKSLIETNDLVVADLHIWRIAPKAMACEIVVLTKTRFGSEYYRKLIPKNYNVRHLIVEERDHGSK